MKRLFPILIFTLLLSACGGRGGEQKEADPPETWISLFEQPASTWTTVGAANWQLMEGVLQGSQSTGQGFAITQATFGNFHLKLEFFPDAVVNSGVFIRCQDRDSIAAENCYELNISDNHQNPDFRTGAIVTRAKPIASVATINQWNRYEVKAEGEHLQVWVNDIKTADLRDTDFKNGFIALQVLDTGTIRFRNVMIREP